MALGHSYSVHMCRLLQRRRRKKEHRVSVIVPLFTLLHLISKWGERHPEYLLCSACYSSNCMLGHILGCVMLSPTAFLFFWMVIVKSTDEGGSSHTQGCMVCLQQLTLMVRPQPVKGRNYIPDTLGEILGWTGRLRIFCVWFMVVGCCFPDTFLRMKCLTAASVFPENDNKKRKNIGKQGCFFIPFEDAADKYSKVAE